MNRELRFYRTESGHCPIERFIDSLTGQQARKIAWVLNLIEELDLIPTRYFKKLVNTDGLWEARIDFSGNTFRILGFFDGNNLIVLNHAFHKKAQKTPKRDITLAQKRMKEYFRRKK